ncbi:uncharacterized protein LAESUDRAFT_743071 [Laetiporus sulphureus 93-53]|uniref:Uncharacterized protein n=1 Tax=Laetiporus sulphureus 93-53 TaxID=1314785 RepID=A0A165EGW0_9APHY|nr:uncharacterized protein LAESUDRAFT_743071 [Laetiporus sulphureus 93-53]KZT07027.1 hypothetical protein LAESUDRAFT_743071 [Laetiporus sulphureus 93-53]
MHEDFRRLGGCYKQATHTAILSSTHSATAMYRFPSIVLYILSCMCLITSAISAPVAAAISPSLICYQNATVIWKSLIFFAMNYVAHAASVPTSAEVGRYTRHVTLQRHFPWASIICLFLPFGGLARAILVTAQQLRWNGDDIRAALAHGALLVVARTERWTPLRGVTETVFVRLPEDLWSSNKVYAFFELETEDEAHWEIDHHDHAVYGDVSLPEGYTLAAPANKSFTENIIRESLEDTGTAVIPRSQSLLKMVASLIQIVSASITLYLSSGNQLARWGYAAYGLTVFPYALMSFMKMIYARLVGDYNCGHVLRTPILEEAERREGGFPVSIRDLKAFAHSGYVPAELLLKDANPDTGEPAILLINTEEFEDKELKFSSCPIHDAHKILISPITHNGPAPEDKLQECRSLPWWETASIVTAFLIVMILPYILIYSLTGFQAAASTVAERAWMTAWLSANQASLEGGVIPKEVQALCVAALCAPAIGGMVMVFGMFLEGNGFGVCPSTCGH